MRNSKDTNGLHVVKTESEHEEPREEKSFAGLIRTAIIAVVALGACAFLWFGFSLDSVSISGCSFYGEEELKQIIVDSSLKKNSLFLSSYIKLKDDLNIPFIEMVEAELDGRHSVKITVYEKEVIGCIPYMGEFICFDKDGIMVGSKTEQPKGIPAIEGIRYSSIVYNEKIAADNKDVFDVILNVTQLIKKNELKIEHVDIDDKDAVIVYCGDIKVLLGSRKQYDEPLSALGSILEQADGLSGTLNMENYSAANRNVVFVKTS